MAKSKKTDLDPEVVAEPTWLYIMGATDRMPEPEPVRAEEG